MAVSPPRLLLWCASLTVALLLLCLLKDKDRGGEEVEDKGVHRDTAAAALLSVMQVEDIVVWLQVDILPALRDGIVDECREGDAALLELCTFLLELSRASEACDDHPFNALSVADLVATLSASLSSEELGQECKRVQEEAAVLRQNLYLQASLLQQWNQKLSFAEISTTGLSGALAAHLRSVPEEALLESITLTVRPLILQFNESLDAMLYEWIHETIHSTVISNDSTDAGDSSRETRHADDDSDRNVGWDHQGRGGRGGGRNRDGDTVELGEQSLDGDGDEEGSFSSCCVRHSRLVVVAAAIELPEIQAKALLLLLQILPMTADEISTAPAPTSNSSSGRSAIATLRVMVQDVSPLITADARDALVEALRTRQLRQLAWKYNIQGFDPRNQRQAKAVVNVMIRRTGVSSTDTDTNIATNAGSAAVTSSSVDSIVDVLTFVEAYSSSSIDTSGLLTKALLYRIIPSHFSLSHAAPVSTFSNARTPLQAALDCIPSHYLSVVLEDVCSFLVDLVGDLSASCQDSEAEDCPHLRSMFAAAVSGAVTICSTFLDLRSEQSDTRGATGAVRSTPSTVLMENITTQRNTHTTFINSEMYLSLKRLRKLSSEFDIYFCLQELNDENICRALLQKQAERQADILIAAMATRTVSTGAGAPQEHVVPVPAHLRKLCSLLDVSHMFVSQKMMRYVLARGHLVSAVSDMIHCRSLCDWYGDYCLMLNSVASVLHVAGAYRR